MQDTVVITELKKGNYGRDYVSLPKNYGKPSYFARADVQAIYRAVYENLDILDREIHFAEKLPRYRHILIKPNLVSVFHRSGMRDRDYPESTDPRVLDAVVAYLKQYSDRLVIVESSGKPMPTATSFKASGVDRIASFYRTGLVALETCEVSRYMLPKAQVMREVYVPKLLDEVIRGEAFFVSVPKLKTNVYTKVTLGFKNSMGVLPYFFRERNHSHALNKKLADLLYLFKPDLVLIDGVIGGEGNTPAPVEPVAVGVIVSGNNAVEVDKAGCRLMGIDPGEVPLIREAEERGFGNSGAVIIGSGKAVPFKRANSSLMDEEFCRTFPGILTLAGHTLPQAPRIRRADEVTPELARRLEQACDGGCLCAVRSGFDYVKYSPRPRFDFPLTVIVGGGICLDGGRYWFDREGRAYEEREIRAMDKPILTVGNCASVLEDCASFRTPGCCSPSTCMLAAASAAGVPFPLLTKENCYRLSFAVQLLKVVGKRCVHLMRGRWVDCPSEHKDRLYPIPELSEGEKERDYLPWPLPKIDRAMRRRLIMDQLGILKM